MRKKVSDSRVVRKSARARRKALVGAFAVAGVLALAFALTEARALAQTPGTGDSAAQGAKGPKRYKATRRIVVDRPSGQLRMPTTEEVQKLVNDLTVLTKRAAEGLPEVSVPGGGVTVDLDGGFAGVMLARPNEDGTFETRCVFTFEEGAEFMGLVEDVA